MDDSEIRFSKHCRIEIAVEKTSKDIEDSLESKNSLNRLRLITL